MATTGSIGAGIRISLGSKVVLEERSDDKVVVTMDGIESADSRISRTYGAKYSECMKSRSDLLSGGLSSAIAKIYGIGGK